MAGRLDYGASRPADTGDRIVTHWTEEQLAAKLRDNPDIRELITPQEFHSVLADYAGRSAARVDFGPERSFMAEPSKPGNKYNAHKVEADGHTFDSRKEYRRYCELVSLQQAGQIAGLTVHPVYMLQEAFRDASGKRHRAINYEADFAYTDSDGRSVVEDTKGYRTAEFRIKEKLFLCRYPDVHFVVG